MFVIIATSNTNRRLRFTAKDEIDGTFQLRLLAGRNVYRCAKLFDEHGKLVAEMVRPADRADI